MAIELTIYTDGASRGNPGDAAIAFLICDRRKIIEEKAENIGKATNNEAEYRAIIAALEKAISMKAGRITLYSDSQLVVRQVKGEYRIKEARLKALFEKVKRLEKLFESVEYRNVPRENEFIAKADSLVNRALDLVQ